MNRALRSRRRADTRTFLCAATRLTMAITVMAVSCVAQTAATLTTLYSFTGGSDGANPSAGVIFGPGGVLFGTTPYGGTQGYGTVFELSGPAKTRTHTVLYSFQGGSDGVNPGAALTSGAGGVLYGTTFAGGSSGNGTVFQLTPPATSGGAWTETVIYSFQGNPDGSGPLGGLVRFANGALYGTTFGGGAAAAGTVFVLVPPAAGGGAWAETTIYSFKGGQDGSGPESGVTASKGKLYGTTCCGTVGGTAFVLAPNSPLTWSKFALYAWEKVTLGSHPFGSLAVDANGVLYGTTSEGGVSGAGTVFSLTPATKGQHYNLTTIHSFTNGTDGGAPYGQPALGTTGVLYVTVINGCTFGVGGLLAFSPPAGGTGAWTETVLYNFTGGNDGSQPFAGLLLGSNNSLYGTTNFGGASLYGTVYELVP